jgi:hypothetical protein
MIRRLKSKEASASIAGLLLFAAPIGAAASARQESSSDISRARPAGGVVLATALGKARQNEARIRSGRLSMLHVTENLPLSDQELRELIKDPKELAMEMEIARSMVRRSVAEEVILFDNAGRNLMVRSESREGRLGTYWGLFTDRVRKSYNSQPVPRGMDPSEVGQAASIDKALWPPYQPYAFWRGRNWYGPDGQFVDRRLTVRWLGKDPVTGCALLLLDWGPRAEFDQKLWLDPRQGFSITRDLALNRRTGRPEGKTEIRYRRYPGGIWYPDQIVSSYYAPVRAGQPRLTRRETNQVRSALLNPALSAQAFAFPIPRGTNVQDDRVSPPLVWREGVSHPRSASRDGEPAEARPPKPLQVGQVAPSFELPSLAGQHMKLSDWEGKVVVLNLFAFW